MYGLFAANTSMSWCEGAYKCQKSSRCLPLTSVCDGSQDCLHGDDEDHCDFICPLSCTCTPLVAFCRYLNLTEPPTNITANMKKLDLSYNNITLQEGQIFGHLSYLVELVLINNRVGPTILPNTFDKLQNLHTLDLSFNLIEKLVMGSFLGLNNLRKIDLRGNPIVSLEPGCFLGLSRLPSLYLNNFSIPVISGDTFEGLDSVKSVSLYNNSIKYLKTGALSNLENLEILDISKNNIERSNPKDFSALSKLKLLDSDDYMFCCYVDLPGDSCYPKADEFSSCSDLMKNNTLRAFLWILGLMALLGNGFVLVWRTWNEFKKMNVPGFLVMNLAGADMLMGIYMICIAAIDTQYRGVYVQYATAWKNSTFCSILGCISTISSEASVFILCVITADRLKNIVFPLSGKRINVRRAGYVMICVWSLAIALGVAPLFPSPYFKGQFYSRSGVCVSLHITNDKNPGWEYSSVIFHGLNFCTFVFILSAYGYMYHIIRDSQQMALSTTQKKVELTAARKMTVIVMTDFLCWIPINIMGMKSVQMYYYSSVNYHRLQNVCKIFIIVS